MNLKVFSVKVSSKALRPVPQLVVATGLRENILFWGMVFMLLFLIFAAFWADYVYYKVNFRELDLSPAKLSGKILTAEDIDEVITLLDKRTGLLQEVLQSGKKK